ncbi:DegT/DnrJ/EryC1/StrS aminotransferase family protein [Sulfurimonas sp.]|uniref:DegT/DnrJ/EryC1/StrS family aminotransferase n=1 Tax=Sulfurimonas sp. TaxID=2022749 RepID=UPI00261093D6|nr:DegT/DnrJ/EryC1/StrS aminotransferase family protein [Sulfurimonas sp.]MCW8895333.1 DegT/DnrJ/EryC1/StrS aminotransferase family protein [Sulfurimonas sp.]
MINFIPLAKPDIGDDEINLVVDTIKSGWLTTGPKVTEFENALSEYLKYDDEIYSLGLNSCTSALFLALLALDVKVGDEVIVPTWTFAATAQVVDWIGAKVVLCDIEEDTLNIDVHKAKKLITDKTKAIIPVHIAGYPCDIQAISDLAKKYNLKVIEDAAHAIGTSYKDKKIGNFSDITCFSFYATKNLAMGEGGAAVSKDKELIEKMRKLSYFGINKEAFKRYEKAGRWYYDIEEIGYKANLDSLHAALGIIQLNKLDKMNKRRRYIASYYRKNLTNKLTFNKDSDEHSHTYHLFPIRLPKNINRDDFIEELKENNIGASVHFIPLHLHTFYKNRSDNNFEVADRVFDTILSIPMCSAMSDEEVEYVVKTINKIVG